RCAISCISVLKWALLAQMRSPAMSASLIGRLESSAFRLSTSTVSMSLTGSCFSSESAPRPFHHGIRRRGGTIFGTPCRQCDGRSKRTYDLTSSIVPRGTSFHRSVEFEFPPIGLDAARFSCCCCGPFSGPTELGTVNPYAVHDHSQPARQGHDRLFHPTAPADLHRPGLEPGPFLRMQHALSCLVEHHPHHLISAARYSAVPIDLARLILGARQPKHRPNCLGSAEASGHVDRGAIG